MFGVKTRNGIKVKNFTSYIPREVISEAYIAFGHLPGSRRFHNLGRDGLFLHSWAVSSWVVETSGFAKLDTVEKRLIIAMAFLHDMWDKANISESFHFCYRYLRSCIAMYFLEVEDYMCYGIARLVFNHHHGFMDGPMDINSLTKATLKEDWFIEAYVFDERFKYKFDRFISFLQEVARADAYDAGFSRGSNGESFFMVNSDDFE